MAKRTNVPYKTVGEMLLHFEEMGADQREACADFCETEARVLLGRPAGQRDDKTCKVFISAAAKFRGEDAGAALIKAFPVRFDGANMPERDKMGNIINDPNSLKQEAVACLAFVKTQASQLVDSRTIDQRRADLKKQIAEERAEMAGMIAAGGKAAK
jgi:hypothetical protein